MTRALLLLAPTLLLAAVAGAAGERVVEDWSRHPVGATGIPDGWKGQTWGHPAYDFRIVEDQGRKVLHIRSRDEGSTIAKEIRGLVDLRETPVLEWSWKVTRLPAGGNSCRKATDDQAVQIYVAWPRFPEALRSRIIGYVWDTTQPAGTVCRSEKTGTVTYIVVRSGSADLGQWLTEARNVREDFRRVFGEDPDNPAAVSIAIDTNDTRSTAEAFVGRIAFRRP
jgi:hypothetical protein